MKISIALAVATASMSTVAVAQTVRDLDSHEHGSASLNVALDSNALYLELETPWDNLVGFEHKPSTDEQRKLVSDALAALNQPDSLFTLSGGDCTVTDALVESAMATGDADDHDDHHDDDHDKHHDDDHAEHHDDDHAEHHDDDHAGHDHDEDTHSTALVLYSYECQDLSRLSEINVDLFARWTGFEELNVQLIGPGGQTSTALSADQTVINIDAVQ